MAAGDEVVWADLDELGDYTIRASIGRLQQAVAQSIPDATLTALTWTTEDIDTDGQHDTGANTARITPNVAGYYRFDYLYYTAAMTTPANMDVSLRKNGSGTIASGNRSAGATVASSLSGWTLIEMNGTTDYVEVLAFQDSAGAVNSNVSARFTSVVTWELRRPV
jgi:hypothetical protein